EPARRPPCRCCEERRAARPARPPLRSRHLAFVLFRTSSGVKRSLKSPGAVTLAQLQSFVLVARLGSVKAAAAELEVTEPAVSVAVGALRKELGDELFVREGRGIALTPGGRRLAALASEILGLAEQA